jgi:hypothetical protein
MIGDKRISKLENLSDEIEANMVDEKSLWGEMVSNSRWTQPK